MIPYDALSELIVQLIEAHKRKVIEYSATGGAADFAQYRYFVGKHDGLNDALEAVREAKRQLHIQEGEE